jgi:GTP-binding protein Era
VRTTLADVDVIAMCFPADQPIGPGDRMIGVDIQELKRSKKVALLTKTDTVSKDKVAKRLMEIQELAEKLEWNWEHIIPISSVKGDNLETLKSVLISILPLSPALYPLGAITEETDEALVGELIREAALAGVHDELPHSIAVVIEDMELREDKKMLNIQAFLFVERDSQKGIIIGKQGTRLKEVGQTARLQIEKLLGVKVYLDLRVKVAPDWQRDPKQLNRLGF